MNDEQQLWKDVQKFMSQFNGFVAVSKKIGEIGDLAEYEASVRHKVAETKQEIIKQREILASERAAAETAMSQKQQEMEEKVRLFREQETAQRAALMTAKADSDRIISADLVLADREASRILAEAQAEVDVLKATKNSLEKDVKALQAKLDAVTSDHAASTKALAKVKEDHANFVKALAGLS